MIMILKDNIKNLVGEQEFNNVLTEVKENLSIETTNFKNTKKISTVCLIVGVLCLFIPAFWIGAAILLVIGLATHKLKTDAKKKVNIFNEVLFFLTENVESSQENFDRYKYLISQL
ncbi:hypothetical protein [Acinetobacter calcoaceticus]|uniref:ABC-type dipeptide/oligopeptide/nickel transport system permease component n=1 Tax=Acinetobacter calcoaceticus TaxID=471 RepID=A0ABD5AKY6_ACICA|nr:hypothetical protein [Acinetobacter calcoaceticus]MDP9803157.1 ABC-type dipeptide/oligopeptide/nickel transport system permease component [Acinetobacter calcoaceticus]